jgi:radical SAM superfamily enzyme YgiQ (UPF0313 family)
MKIVLLNLPNPPGCGIYREYAGGFGISFKIASRHNGETAFPIYLLYAASAAMKCGCEFEILDAQINKQSLLEVVEAIKSSQPDIVISWLSLPYLYHDMQVLNNIKKENPRVFVITLGVVCNLLPTEILQNSSIDLIIKGTNPYYNLIVDLINRLQDSRQNVEKLHDQVGGAIYVKDGKVIQSTKLPCTEDISDLLLDTYYHFPVNKYLQNIRDNKGILVKYFPILTSVGCPHDCIYCPFPVGYGNKVITKPINQIVDEVQYLNTNFNLETFFFRAQVFTINRKRVLQLCDEIINRNLHIKWFVEARVDEVSKEILTKMKEAGCFRVHFGVETGSSELLKEIGKPGTLANSVVNTFHICNELGLSTTANMIIGLPGENMQTLKNSYNFLRRINPDNISFNMLTPYPGTKLFEVANKMGLIPTYEWSKYTLYDAVMGSGQLSASQLERARKQMETKLYYYKLFKNPVYLRQSIRHLGKKFIQRFIKP